MQVHARHKLGTSGTHLIVRLCLQDCMRLTYNVASNANKVNLTGLVVIEMQCFLATHDADWRLSVAAVMIMMAVGFMMVL